jgi:hypothetical protein
MGGRQDPFVKNAVLICGSPKTYGHNYAFLEGPVSALQASSYYDEGGYEKNNVHPKKSLLALLGAHVFILGFFTVLIRWTAGEHMRPRSRPLNGFDGSCGQNMGCKVFKRTYPAARGGACRYRGLSPPHFNQS